MRQNQRLLRFAVPLFVAFVAGCAPPFYRAAKNGDDGKVLAFLNAGTDVNQTYYDVTALSFAARAGRVSTVKLLLNHGADIKLDPTAICMAAMSDSVPTVKMLLDHGADINTRLCQNPFVIRPGSFKPEPGWTPLDTAVAFEKTATAGYLRSHGGVRSGAGSERGGAAGSVGAAGSDGAESPSTLSGTFGAASHR